MSNPQKVLPVRALAQRSSERFQTMGVDETHTVSDLLDRADREALSFFDRSNEGRGLQQALMCPRIQPSRSSPQHSNSQPSGLEIETVDLRDLEFAAI